MSDNQQKPDLDKSPASEETTAGAASQAQEEQPASAASGAQPSAVGESQPEKRAEVAESGAAQSEEAAKEPEADASSADSASEPEADKAEEGAASAYLGNFNACFDGLAKIGPLVLLAALLCMAWPIFWEPAKGVYCPAEIRSLTAFLHSVATGSWLAPTGLSDGGWTVAQWPVFNWCIGLMALSPSLIASGYLLPTTSFICAFFAVLGVWCLAHAAGFGYRAAFAAGLILLCAPLFAPLPHFVGPATTAAGFFLFALVFFCRGWRVNTSWFSLPVAFALTALAGLAGGPLFLIVPLAASFCFLIWQGTLRRACRADAIFGFIILLAIIGCWLGVILTGDTSNNYLRELFDGSCRLSGPFHIKWLLPVAAGILGTMPWILMIFGVNWFHVLGQAGKTLKASRHDNSSALIWISLAIMLPLAIFVPWFHPVAVAIACLVAILLGKAATNLRSGGSRFFYLLASICLMIAGLAILCASFESTQSIVLDLLPVLPTPDLGNMLLTLSMLPVIGGIVLLAGIIALMFVKRFSGCGPLIYGICLVTIICQFGRLSFIYELAAMPHTPLIPFSEVQARVEKAMAAPTQSQPPAETQPAFQAQPEEAPALAQPPAETQPDYQIPAMPAPEATAPAEAPVQPEAAPVPDMAPAAPAIPAAPEAPQPGATTEQTVQPEAASPAPGVEPVQPEAATPEINLETPQEPAPVQAPEQTEAPESAPAAPGGQPAG